MSKDSSTIIKIIKNQKVLREINCLAGMKITKSACFKTFSIFLVFLLF